MANGQIPVEQLTRVGSSLTIEELAPASPGASPRRVKLLGPALPFQGAEWGMSYNVQTSWYPGNREATQQMLGPRELPSSWEGMWKRTQMGKEPTHYTDETGAMQRIVSPHVLREILESIFTAGIRLRVTWAVQGTTIIGNPADRQTVNDDYTIVREGRATNFRTPIDRHTDIRWNIEFQWSGRGGGAAKVVSAREDSDVANAVAILEAAALDVSRTAANDKILASTPKNRHSATNLTLGQLENVAGAPGRAVQRFTRSLQSKVSDVKRVGDIARKMRDQPYAVANQVVDFARNTQAIANDFVSAMGRQGPEQKSLSPKVSSLLRAHNYFARVVATAILSARRGAELEAAYRKTVVATGNTGALTVRESSTTRAGDILAVHVTKAGDTPVTISMRYYGNADQGGVILRANRLPTYTPTLPPGRILVIPVLTNATAQRLTAV